MSNELLDLSTRTPLEDIVSGTVSIGDERLIPSGGRLAVLILIERELPPELLLRHLLKALHDVDSNVFDEHLHKACNGRRCRGYLRENVRRRVNVDAP